MTEVLTIAQMRAVERAAIDSGRVSGLALMERAGQGVVDAMRSEWPELESGGHRALVLCGPGNNGGDGFVVARLLAALGWEVRVWLYGAPEGLPPDARVTHDRWCAIGGVGQLAFPMPSAAWEAMLGWAMQDRQRPLHVVDALFGIGRRQSVLPDEGGDPAMLPVALGALLLDHGGPPIRRIAVDIPSALCADSGRILLAEGATDDTAGKAGTDGSRFANCGADLTVTFHRPKPGHLLADGPQLCNRLVVVDLGLPPSLHPGPMLVTIGPPLRGLGKTLRGHKFAHGHAVVLAGPPGRGGAARLAARGALRVGAGLVTLACPPLALAENAARLDAVMLRGIADTAALAAMLQDPRIRALCIGPGLGLEGRAAALVGTALDGGLAMPTTESAPFGESMPQPFAETPAKPPAIPETAWEERPALVLDADALTLLARNPALFGALHAGCVLTPHGGEFARLFPDLADRLAVRGCERPAFSKSDATRLAAERAGCVVVFKGQDTVIASPDGRAAIHCAAYGRAAPWLATAGSGDVLAGFIAGLLARGDLDPFEAACTAVWLHVECARSFGPGLIAEDLPEQLPAVLRSLRL